MKVYLSDDKDTVVVFFEDREDPDWYSVEEFIAAYGEEALPESKVDDLQNESFAEYWDAAIELVNAWANYQAKRKLYVNATCDETVHRVADVIAKSYDNDLRRLKRQAAKFFTLVDEGLDIFRYYCRVYGMEPVDIMWLRTHLFDKKDYRRVRDKCKRRKAANKSPVSLYELI